MTVGVENLYQAQWIFQAASQRPEDAVTNTTHWHKTGSISDFENVRDMLVDFYSVIPTGATNRVQDFFTTKGLTGNWQLKMYKLSDDKPRAPAYTSQGSFELQNVASLPSEVALVMSFQTEPESGLPQARRRNRIYLGPFAGMANSEVGRPSNLLVETLLFAGHQMIVASDESIYWAWHVYSPTQNAHYPTISGWVDNAWDSQRRRGVDATLRGGFDVENPT